MIHSNSKYKQLAEMVISQIHTGKWLVGEKMISLRRFSKQFSVSMTTAIRCYDYLQELGYLSSKLKSGFYIKKPFTRVHSPLFPQFNSQISKGLKPYTPQYTDSKSPFSIAQLSPELSDIHLLQKIMYRVIRLEHDHHYSYGNPQGSDRLRENLSHHFSSQGFPINSDEIVITNGCIEAITLSLEVLTSPNDVIAVSSPCFNGILDLLALLQRKVIEIPSTPEGLDLVQLEHHFKKDTINACIFTSSHQNPTGHSLSIDQKKKLAQLANTYHIPIIEDDVYGELSHNAPYQLPIKFWDKNGWVLWCTSISKTLSAGLRLGWCLPGRFQEEFLKHRYLRTLGVNVPIQEGLAEYIARGHYATHLSRVNKRLYQNLHHYNDYLALHLPKNTRIYQPSGGMVLWIDIPTISSITLANETEKMGIAIRSGTCFSHQEFYKSHFRLNFGWPLTERIRAKLDSLVSCINHLV